jgi:hypothetical protein
MATNINLTWINPTSRINNDPLNPSEFTTTIEHMDPGEGNWTVIASDIDSSVTAYAFLNAATGLHKFRIYAVDISDVRVSHFAMVNATIHEPRPSSRAAVSATIVTT